MKKLENINIINIENLDSILSSENTLYKYNDLYINIYRVKNDMYGNPMYHAFIYDSNENNISENYKKAFVRYYKKGQYLSFQSYNISNSLKNILSIEG